MRYVPALLLLCAACSGPPAPAPVGEPEATVAAVNLWSAYSENAVGAGQRYGGKAVRITGRVREIGADEISFETIAFGAASPSELRRMSDQERRWFDEGGPPGGVACRFDPARRDAFGKVAPGKTVAVVGRVLGGEKSAQHWRGLVVRVEMTRPAE